MANWHVGFTKTGADSVQQVVEVIADATVLRRTKWFSFGIACTAASNDGVHSYIIHRVTGTATGTAVTPNALDPADTTAAVTDAKHLITADAASFAAGAELYREPLNGRASWQWNANPGKELVTPATASNGASIGLGAASTSTYGGNVMFEEV